MQATTSPRIPGRVAECSDTPPVRFGSQHKKAATDSEAVKGPGKWSKTSLSQGAKGDDSQGSVGGALESAGDADERVGYWAGELRQLLWLALPVMAQVASQPAMIITDQLMLGHFLGAEKLAAAALGHSVRRPPDIKAHLPTAQQNRRLNNTHSRWPSNITPSVLSMIISSNISEEWVGKARGAILLIEL
jgi:hypothetical protein